MPQFSPFLALNAVPDHLIGRLRRITNRTPFHACNDRTRSLFIHVPKAAGTSVSIALYGREVGHLPAAGYRAADAAKFHSYFKFAFVRDPAERFKSAYSYLMNGGSPADRRFTQKHLAQFADRSALLAHLLQARRAGPWWSLLNWGHFRPQVDYIAISGKIAVDYLGRLETIEDDFAEISQRVTGEKRLLGQHNRSQGPQHSPLTIQEQKAVEEIYLADYEALGYARSA